MLNVSGVISIMDSDGPWISVDDKHAFDLMQVSAPEASAKSFESRTRQ